MKAARVNANLSLDDMASIMKISKSTINRWERGKTPIPQLKFTEFCKICNIETSNVKANIKLKGE